MEERYKKACLYLMDELAGEIGRLQRIQKQAEAFFAETGEEKESCALPEKEKESGPVDYLQIIYK